MFRRWVPIRLRDTRHDHISWAMALSDEQHLDSLQALRLQLEWGADEALLDAPLNRLGRMTPDVDAPRRILTRPEPALVASPPATAPAPIAAETLDALHDALAAFTGCPLRATATKTVRPSGNPAAGLLVIGEAPGAEDDRTGHAFSGLPGQMLDRVLGSAGLDRTGLLLTTLVPWRPPGNRAPNEAEIQACLPFLLRLVAITRPVRLVLLGGAPVRLLLGGSEVARKLRGRWQAASVDGVSIPALPMLPFDQWLRNPAAKRDTWADLLTLRSNLGR